MNSVHFHASVARNQHLRVWIPFTQKLSSSTLFYSVDSISNRADSIDNFFCHFAYTAIFLSFC